MAPACEADGLVDEVTPAAEDGTAAAGEPIAEAMVALQEVMEPAPVAAPALEGERVFLLAAASVLSQLVPADSNFSV